MGADSTVNVRITVAYRVGPLLKTQKYPRDILVRFHDWHIKQTVQGIFRDQQGLDIQGEQIKVFSDLSTITIRK